jgi:hypothetical protein
VTGLVVGSSAAVRAASCSAEELPQLVRRLLAELVESVAPARTATVVTLSVPRSAAGPRLRPWAGSGPADHDLDAAQAAAGQGPAFLAAATDEPVVSDDVAADPRWVLAPVSVSAMLTSVVAIALPGAPGPRAVLVVQGDGPDLTDAVGVAQVVDAVPELTAAVAVVRARLEVANLQLALTSNRTIGAAIGVAMATRTLPYDDAAQLLRSLSNHTNTRLLDLAEQVLLTGELPAVPGESPAMPPSMPPSMPRPRRPGGAAGGR